MSGFLRDPGRGEDGASFPESAYRLTAAEVLARLDSDPNGLTAAEARRRLDAHGPNTIASGRRAAPVIRFLAQFTDWLILLLIVCAVVVASLGDATTASVLAVLVLLNTTIGFVQEFRAEHAMDALAMLVHPTAEAMRDGGLAVVDSASLVPGDVIRLTEGESVPADARLIAVTAFATNEFALTGESAPTRMSIDPQEEDVPVAGRHNMVYAGTSVASGEATAVVTATAMATELGRIARLSQTASTGPSPVQREMATIAKVVGVTVAVLSLLLLAAAVAAHMPFREALLFAVGLACALVPQGLPAEVNTGLAQASATLARQRALVKKLSAVETLGATHVICTDKTGTLTKNEMTVVEAVIGFEPFLVSGTGYAPAGRITSAESGLVLDRGNPFVARFAAVGVLAGSARLRPPDDDHPDWFVLGDPTEGALLPFAAKAGLDPDRIRAGSPEVLQLPFDSVRKRMSSVRRDPDGSLVLFVKGSPESVLACATSVLDHGVVRPITAGDRDGFAAEDERRATRALRNLAFAVREMDADELPAASAEGQATEQLESGLTLLGLVSMMDPLRDDVPQAMAVATGAGVRVNIVTGDSALTAGAIAESAGLAGSGPVRTIRGEQLLGLSDDEVRAAALAGGVVFSRVAPEDKMRVVTLVKESGAVVAVTGDGINDAPALKTASIGVAMGRTGTDVAKQSADVVLLDDSFGTLVVAIREGRAIYANIAKGVLSCLTSNVAEFVVNAIGLLLTSLAGIPLAINVLQILAIDVLGEILPISTLGSDPEQGDSMRREPRDPRARILNGRSFVDILASGTAMGVLALVGYLLAYPAQGLGVGGGSQAQIASATTVTYVTILLTQLANIVQRRSAGGLFSRYQLSNALFWLSCAAALAVMGGIVFVPAVAGFFGTAPIPPVMWWYVVGAMIAMLLWRTAIARMERGRDGRADGPGRGRTPRRIRADAASPSASRLGG